jgi:hypothetical protein
MPVPALEPFRSDGVRLKIGRKHLQHTVNVRQVRAVLIEFPL